MKAQRLFWTSSALCLMLASCQKQKNPGAGSGQSLDDLAAERAALEDERMSLERERLEEERAALEEQKEALRAERESRLAAREKDAAELDTSLEDRQREIDQREAELADREGDLAARESNLSDQEYVYAGNEPLDDWEPEPEPVFEEPVGDYTSFYDDLQPYGSWYETPDYGYVYQPTVVIQDGSWRPYTRGRWACTNRGWNWCSDEPFGWACFHYGRWCQLPGRGWVWVPGDEWAPSWVCWREGGDHIGWAPLPPETLCYRGRGWDSKVESEFGIGWSMFTFVHCRHMAEPLWRHCLPVDQNRAWIGKTSNITNIKFHRNEIVSGGPKWDKLRKLVGKPWPVYQLQVDRLKALNQKANRNAVFRGNQLAVFAPNLNTRWNAQLKPSRVAGKWDDVKLDRADNSSKPEWRERFRESRQKQKEQAAQWASTGGDRQKQLETNRKQVATVQEKVEVKQKAIVEERREKMVQIRDKTRDANRPQVDRGDGGKQAAGNANGDSGKAPLAERYRQNAERMREARSRRNGGEEVQRGEVDRGQAATQIQPKGGEDQTPRGNGNPAERMRDRREQNREAQADNGGTRGQVAEVERPTQPQAQPSEAAQPTNRRERMQENRQQQQEQAQARQQQQADENADQVTRRERMEEARQQAEQNNQRQQLDQANQRQRQQAEQANQRQQQQQQEQAKGEQEENTRRQRMEEARQQQQERARQQQEQAGQQAEENTRRQRMEEARERQQEAARERAEQNRQQQDQAREQQEQARRQQEDNGRRQQQEEARRQQQEENARRQEQERAQQQERMRQQEENRRQAEERARQQQEERARQQEQARQQQEERARQQEEARRQQQEERAREQEENRRQAEERARQQEESRREQQERARQQQEEQSRQQQQERARQEQERSRNQDEERQRGRGR